MCGRFTVEGCSSGHFIYSFNSFSKQLIMHCVPGTVLASRDEAIATRFLAT